MPAESVVYNVDESQAETLIERMCFEPPPFLRSASAASAMLTVSNTECALVDAAISAGWRVFEVKTRVDEVLIANESTTNKTTAVPMNLPFPCSEPCKSIHRI